VIGVIAAFTSTYSVPISQQNHRTLDTFWFFVLSNPYVLTTTAIALVLGAAALRRRYRGRPRHRDREAGRAEPIAALLVQHGLLAADDRERRPGGS
jgi:hypothetical protein